MGFINHDKDIGRIVQLREGLAPLVILEFMDHAEDEVRCSGAEQLSQLRDRTGWFE